MFKRKRRSKFLYLLFFITVAFIVHKFIISFADITKCTYSALLYPVLLSQKHIILPIKQRLEKRKTNQELQELVFKLHREKELIIAENIQLKSTHSFYTQIKELLEFKKRYHIAKPKLCHIIFKHITHASHFVFINKGSRDGVEKDMIAVYNNFLLGRIVETYPFYSKLLLITDKSCKVAAYCAKTNSHGIHVGTNSECETALTRVNHFEEIKSDDMVLSSGHGLVFPQGFALGKITDIQNGELYHKITLKILFNIKNIDYCFLIKKGNYHNS